MQRNVFLMTGLLFSTLCVTTIAQAGCPCGTGGNLPALLNEEIKPKLDNNTVCAIQGSDKWQEYHDPNGRIWEMGNNPTSGEDVGSWGPNGSSQVSYSYGSGGTYAFTVCPESAGTDPRYSFCGPRLITNVRLQPGKGTCTAF